MNLLGIPEEVIFHNILPKLSLNDNLRLRRVSKDTKDLVDSFIHLNFRPRMKIEIGTVGSPHETWSSFLQNEPHNTLDPSIHLKVQDTSTLQTSGARQFLLRYGHRVTKLHLHDLDIPIVSPEVINFLENLANLQYLKITEIKVVKRVPTSNQRQNDNEAYVPITFKTLQRLDIGRDGLRDGISGFLPPSSLLTDLQTVYKFITDCSSNLKYLKIPRVNYTVSQMCPGGPLSWLSEILVKRHHQFPNKSNLYFINMKHFEENDDEYPSAQSFFQLTSLSRLHQVKLLNVHAKLIEGLLSLDIQNPVEDSLEEAIPNVDAVVASLRNMDTYTFVLDMPTLEKIAIDNGTTFNCRISQEKIDYFEPADMPNLKSLMFVVDSPTINGEDSIYTPEDFYQFFFQPRHARVKMENLKMQFTHRYFPETSFNKPVLEHPRLRNVILSCPNLTKITLKHWPGSDKGISKLWTGLKHLETVCFGGCENLGNYAFVGEDLEEPLFLKAKKLRRLTLEALDEMPKITDTLFCKVLCHSKLRELYLRCEIMRPARSISLSGIECLLTGEFAKSIEKFPLHGQLILEGVAAEDLKKLEAKFRSAKMM